MGVFDWLGVIKDLFTVGSAIAEAVKDEDFARAEEILGEESRTSIAKRAAEVRAAAKFGPRDSEDTLPPPEDAPAS